MNREFWMNMSCDSATDLLTLTGGDEQIYITPIFLPCVMDVREIWLEIPSLGSDRVTLALYEQEVPYRKRAVVAPTGGPDPDELTNTPTFRLVRAPEILYGPQDRYRARLSKPETLDPDKAYAVAWSCSSALSQPVGRLSYSHIAFRAPTWTQLGLGFGAWPRTLAIETPTSNTGNPQLTFVSELGLRRLAQ